MVFEPTGGDSEGLLGNRDVLRFPIHIRMVGRRPLTTRMWERLFREMNEAALRTDYELYEQALRNTFYSGQGFEFLRSQTNRFIIISIDRGSIEVVGAILLAAGWAYKKFIEPGWDQSASKKAWDETVAGMIDKSVPILKEQIDARVVQKLKQLKIERISLQPPTSERRLVENSSAPETELIYDKPKQIEHLKKDQ